MHGSSILATPAGCAANAVELRKGPNGRWSVASTLPGIAGMCVASVDIDTDRAIISANEPQNYDATAYVRIFERSASGWISAGVFSSDQWPTFMFGQALAIRGSLAIASSYDLGSHVYRKGAAGWVHAGRIDNPGRGSFDSDGSIQLTDQYLMRTNGSRVRPFVTGYLYRIGADQTFEHVANLVSDTNNAISYMFLSGTRVLAITGDFGEQVVEFELPARFEVPALVQDDFQSGNASQMDRAARESFHDREQWHDERVPAVEPGRRCRRSARSRPHQSKHRRRCAADRVQRQ